MNNSTAHLLALAAPARHHDEDDDAFTNPDTGEVQPLENRLGKALVEYVTRYPGEKLPTSGGVNASVLVRMNYDTLIDSIAPVTFSTGGTISASQARMLACEAGIIPMVLNGASQPLDVGRKQRFHTPYQRIAITERDHTCTTQGCDMPPSMCAVHHDHPWALDGHTNVGQGRLLCWAHHHRIHDPACKTTTHPNNKVGFHRRT